MNTNHMMCEQINVGEGMICVMASQIANVGESIIGAALQEREGFRWVSEVSFEFCDSLFTYIYIYLLIHVSPSLLSSTTMLPTLSTYH